MKRGYQLLLNSKIIKYIRVRPDLKGKEHHLHIDRFKKRDNLGILYFTRKICKRFWNVPVTPLISIYGTEYSDGTSGYAYCSR